MNRNSSEQVGYFFGIAVSLLAHVFFAILSVVVLEARASSAARPSEVFSVTLEGGEKLGGIGQAPDPSQKATKVLPNQLEATQDNAQSETKPTETEKKLESTAAVEDPEKILAAKRALELKQKQEAEKKQKELDLKKLEEKKAEEKKAQEKKAAEEEKKRAEQEKKDKEAEKQKEDQEAKAKKARDDQFKKALAGAAKRYKGESADAGGEGFGAAALGGKGMGGGTLQSLEFVAYRNQLEQHIKSGWRWLPGPKQFKTVVVVKILPDGTISAVEVAGSSGNDNFDSSVVRAVQKASPVPAAPPQLYEQYFREVRITFDSQQ